MCKIANICFGRYQPVTKGHAAHFEQMIADSTVSGADTFVFTSTTQNDKNPLHPDTKVRFLERVLAGHACPVRTSRDIFTAAESLVGKYDIIVYFAGGDYFESPVDRELFLRLSDHMKKHGVECRQFSTGTRTDGISGTAMREAAYKEDMNTFISLSPVGHGDFTVHDAVDMYNYVVSELKTHNK